MIKYFGNRLWRAILQIISSAMNYDTFGFVLRVGLIYDSISSAFAPGKDLTTNKSSLIDNSQPLTFLTMESPTTTVTLRPFSFLFWSFMIMLIFFMSLFVRFTCRDDVLVVISDNLSLSLLHPFVSLSFQ